LEWPTHSVLRENEGVAKTISWSDRAYSIRERVSRSSLQTWRRRDIEDLFEVKRASAQNLMRLIGNVQSIGSTHFLDRSALLLFLDEVVAAERVSEAVAKRLDVTEPTPSRRSRKKLLRFALPRDLRSVMAKDLPSNIEVSAGSLRIRGADAMEIVRSLHLVAQALQNDLDTMQSLLDPPVPQPQVDDSEIRSMFERLRADEANER
jgi:hypothetical protein